MKQAVTAVIVNRGKILGVSRKNRLNDFGLPGGKVDPGETPWQAIVREVREETGLDINPNGEQDVRHVFERVCLGKTDYNVKTYLVSYFKGELHTEEPIALQWLDVDQLLRPDSSFYEYNLALFSTMFDARALSFYNIAAMKKDAGLVIFERAHECLTQHGIKQIHTGTGAWYYATLDFERGRLTLDEAIEVVVNDTFLHVDCY